MFRFKSILSRIVCLHIIAVAMTSIFMPAALYWLLKSETNNLHRQSMHDNAEAIAQHLVVRPDGTWAINLPAGLRDIYSKAYGRYAYAVLDDRGCDRRSRRRTYTARSNCHRRKSALQR
jgi:hypothetical protein